MHIHVPNTHTHTQQHTLKTPTVVSRTSQIKYIYIYTQIFFNKSTCPRVSTETVPSFWVAAVEHQAIMAATNPVHAPAIAPIALQSFLLDINK